MEGPQIRRGQDLADFIKGKRMYAWRRCGILVILVTVLSTLPGFQACADEPVPAAAPCQSNGLCPRLSAAFRRFRTFVRTEVGLEAPPEPMNTDPVPDQGGFLLHTGAIQLGPGTQQNLVRWQGDGEGGF